MINFLGNVRLSLATLLGSLLVITMISGTCAAAGQTPSPKAEAFRKALKHYNNTVFADYITVRTDKLLSFQPSLLANPDISRFKSGKAKQEAMGVVGLSAFYCLAFGKNAEAAKYYAAFYRLADELSLRDLADIDMRPSPAMEAFFKDPAAATDADLDKVVRELDKKMVVAFGKFASTQEGIDAAIDMAYGTEIEALYLLSQMVIQSDGKSAETIAAMAAEKANIVFAQRIIAAVEGDPTQRKISQIPERKRLLDAVMKTIKRKDGKLGKADAVAILKIVSPERKRIVSGGATGKGAK